MIGMSALGHEGTHALQQMERPFYGGLSEILSGASYKISNEPVDYTAYSNNTITKKGAPSNMMGVIKRALTRLRDHAPNDEP